LGVRKSTQLIKIIQIIEGRFGELSLKALRQWGQQEVEEFLTSLPGIGKKSARCIMMYSLGMKVFPVDTNVFRIMKRWNWWEMSGPIRKYEDVLQRIVPEELRYSLHVNMVAHGRTICTRGRPNCEGCSIKVYCRYDGREVEKTK
jgi:endonuclease-3